jgi:hypothetical protein
LDRTVTILQQDVSGFGVVEPPPGAVHEARESRLAEELGKRWRFFLTYAQFQTGPQSRLLFFFRT